MREVEDWLGEVRGLDDAAHFDGAFFLDEFADGVEEVGRELQMQVSHAKGRLSWAI